MSDKQGNIDISRAVSSIRVGRRHRRDLGDIDALAASIDRDGLLQPITVTPDGVLVCGARRLAAIKQLGWSEIRVWVRSGISDDLGYMLAEQDDNALHKPLTQLEAAELYREMKALLAEDAAQRKAATQLSAENQPRWNGPAESAGPLEKPLGDARRHAAQMVTGASSYTKLEEINFIQRVSEDTAQSEEIRDLARGYLDSIRDGAPVHPVWTHLREVVEAARNHRDALLHRIAEEKLAEIKAGKKRTRSTTQPTTPPIVEPMSARAFVLTWTELGLLCPQADAAFIAARVTAIEAETFFAAIDAWSEFATQLREELSAPDVASDSDVDAPHLRAV